MTHRLFVSDLDGTLLGPRAVFSERSERGLRALLDRGVRFTVATARGAHSIRALLRSAVPSLPAITNDGALTVDLVTGERFATRCLDRDVADAALAELDRVGILPCALVFDGDEERLELGEPRDDASRWFRDEKAEMRDPRLRNVARPGMGRGHDVVTIIAFVPIERVEEIGMALRARVGSAARVAWFQHPYWPAFGEVAIRHPRATKGDALAAVIDRLGVAPADVTAFGDHDNDVEMLALVGRAIVMANASAAAIAVAHERIGHHHEDAVVRFLEEEHQQSA